MSKVVVTKNVSVPVERAWELLSDFGNVYLFNPIVKSADVLSQKARDRIARRKEPKYRRTHRAT